MAHLLNETELSLQRGIDQILETSSISPLAKQLVAFRNQYVRNQLDIGSVKESLPLSNRYFRVNQDGYLFAVVMQEARRDEEQDETVEKALEEANQFIDEMENMDSGLAEMLGVEGLMNLLKNADERERAKVLFFIRTAVNSARPNQVSE